ncbi:MAG TPA: hemolysin family protein [Candidatus Sulfopaludibacter sp.]|jgi:CBS domain containing-hemolysin-like protein|nr:hemolysin family protein [Candidatus Sulfopaludibacter sp.]
MRIIAVILLIAVNGFFAGAEVALLSVRHSRLRQMAEEGKAGAQAALNLLSNPGRLLSVTQVGVTLASLGLGWAGEDALYQFLLGLIRMHLTPLVAEVVHGGCFVASFLAISYFHVVMGEVVPKNIAIARADQLAALVAPALLVFYRISAPFVVIIERSAGAITHALKLRGGGGHAGGHSAEELKLIVSSSRGLGYLPEAQEDMIHRVLDLDNVSVREVMVARNDIVSIDANASLDEVLHTMIRNQHSRLPVFEGTPEKIIGILHYKDLLPVWEERRRAIRGGRSSRGFHVARLLRPHMVVPETKPLSQMLEEFRQGRSHMAMVVDEFGTIAGLLTVEDVLEQLVGRIEDEHDEKSGRPTQQPNDVEVDGATRIRDLESEFGIEIPSEGGFETLAGFLLFRLGEIPSPGEIVEFNGRRYTVLEMDRNRIARVRIEKLPARPAA